MYEQLVAMLRRYLRFVYNATSCFFKLIPALADIWLLQRKRDRKRRPRTIFNPDQLKKLEVAFKKNPYIDKKDRKKLAKALRLDERQVKVWFQNRRAKDRRNGEEEYDEKRSQYQQAKSCDSSSDPSFNGTLERSNSLIKA